MKIILFAPRVLLFPTTLNKYTAFLQPWQKREGHPLEEALNAFATAVSQVEYVAGHNVNFDLNIMGAEFLRSGRENPFRKRHCN